MRLTRVATLAVLLLPLGARAAPLTLADAIATARRNHPDSRAAHANEDVARAQTGVALAGYLPSLGLNGLLRGDVSNFAPVIAGTAASTTPTHPFQGSWLYSASLSISQLVFDGGRTLGQIAASRAALVQASEDRQTAELAIEAAVTASYFASLEADQQLGVSIDYEQQQRGQLASIRKLITAGIRPENDATLAETRAQRASLDRIRAEGTVQTRRATLIAALGLDQDPGFSLVDAFTGAVAEERTPVDDLVGQAMKGRPELRALEAQRRVVENQIRVVRSDYFPSLGLGLAGSMTGSNGAPKPLFDFFGTLNLQEQFFSGLSTYRGTQAARANLELVRAKVAAMRVNVRAAVAAARAALDAATRVDAQAKSLVDQADKLVKSSQKRYDAGLLTLLELSDAQAQRVLAQGQKVTAHYAVALSRADLRRAVGGTILDGDALK